MTIAATAKGDRGDVWQDVGFQGLMSSRIREVLLVASKYDSYILEEDGQLAETLEGEFYQLRISWTPRINTVSTGRAALDILKRRPVDLVITMMRLGDMGVIEFARAAKALRPHMPVVFLADNPTEASWVKEMGNESGIDQAFVWRGDISLFLAMVKYFEDMLNVQRDTTIAGVRVIILIENSVRFYSSYLPLLYKELVDQTGSLMADGVNAAQRLRRMKARAKVLLAEDFEEGWSLFETYRQYVLGVITDARFPREGKNDPRAGLEFVRRIRGIDPELPCLIQSSDEEMEVGAALLGAAFLNKRTPRLLEDVRQFLQQSLGFGDFVFRMPEGDEVARVKDLAAMPKALETVPAESLIYHATRHHFSNWCMARTEFRVAALLRPRKVSDFKDVEELRQHLISAFNQIWTDAHRGVVADFSRLEAESASAFTRIGSGSMGGKGRGLGFMHALLSQHDTDTRFPEIQITVPPAVAIGTDIFDEFVRHNKLLGVALSEISDEEVAAAFLRTSLPASLVEDLRAFLKQRAYPLAVRSSSLLEDSHDRPFAGIYRTYMLPNNNPSLEKRVEDLCTAIKLVYASTYFHNARAYLLGTPYRLEEERMGVVLQRLVGRPHESYHYPDISGVARSYNYYPVLNMKPEDGVTTVALGLGRTVMEGEKAVRFSPTYPEVLPQFSNTAAYLENAQREFYALDLEATEEELDVREERGLVKLDLQAAEAHGTLSAVGSAYSADNDCVYDGLSREGIRLVTFAPILKSETFPLAEIIRYLLDLATDTMSCHVELEFAIDLKPRDGGPPEFGILQTRPMSIEREAPGLEDFDVNVRRDDILCSSGNALGHGRTDEIHDVVYVKPETFDRGKTPEIAMQVGRINEKLLRSGRHYLLIGPGRWGTADRWLGIPVDWSQICAARAIVETDLTEIPVEPSEGTHFFQNLISFGIGYFHVHRKDSAGWIDYDWLAERPAAEETDHVRHVHLEKPLGILVDGRTRRGLVLKTMEE